VPTAVAVVPTSAHGQRQGLTATAVASVSADPPQLMVCVNRASRSASAITAAGRFGLNYLGPEHLDLAEAFAAPIDDPEARFHAARWVDSPSGIPLLGDALASFACDVVSAVDSGTHVVFIGRVTEVRHRTGDALIYRRGAFVHSSDP
jgi:flavin reductase (DIM6/NTAB) family NADH-FMN oxidoreductase RutF